MFTIKSPAIINEKIDPKYGKYSEVKYKEFPVISPPILWDNPPDITKSFALVLQDYDAYPRSGFSVIHWIVADIPADRRELPENASRDESSLIQGKNVLISRFLPGNGPDLTDYYLGPGPVDFPHEYELKLFAVDTVLGLKKGFYYNELIKALRGHVLDEAVLYGLYDN